MIDCNAPADVHEWIYCTAAVVDPINEAIIAIITVAATLALLIGGWKIAKRVIHEIAK